MPKRNYEADNAKRIEDRNTLSEQFGPTKTVWYSDHIFRYSDQNGRVYDFWVDIPPPPDNKAMKCQTLKEAQIKELQYYGKSELYDEPVTHEY